VRPHCQLRHELHLTGVRRGHRRRGQTSLLHNSFSFLFLELPLDSLMLGVDLNTSTGSASAEHDGVPPAASPSRHSRRRAP
jgi:hypothetical protein